MTSSRSLFALACASRISTSRPGRSSSWQGQSEERRAGHHSTARADPRRTTCSTSGRRSVSSGRGGISRRMRSGAARAPPGIRGWPKSPSVDAGRRSSHAHAGPDNRARPSSPSFWPGSQGAAKSRRTLSPGAPGGSRFRTKDGLGLVSRAVYRIVREAPLGPTRAADPSTRLTP